MSDEGDRFQGVPVFRLAWAENSKIDPNSPYKDLSSEDMMKAMAAASPPTREQRIKMFRVLVKQGNKLKSSELSVLIMRETGMSLGTYVHALNEMFKYDILQRENINGFQGYSCRFEPSLATSKPNTKECLVLMEAARKQMVIHGNVETDYKTLAEDAGISLERMMFVENYLAVMRYFRELCGLRDIPSIDEEDEPY